MGLLAILLWPFRLVWRFIGFAFRLMGKMMTLAIGFVLLVAGIVLTCTIAGAFVGIPLLLLGGLLMVRSVFVF